MFDLKAIFSTAMENLTPIMEQTAQTQLKAVPLFGTLNIPMAHAYPVVIIQEEMNGIMDHTSVILLVLMDIGMSIMIRMVGLVLTHVNLNMFDSKMTFSIVLVIVIMEAISPTQPQDALTIGNSNTPMAHAYLVATILTEVSGMIKPISALLLALADTLMLWKRLALTPANLNIFVLKMISFTVKVIQIRPMELTTLIPQLDALHLVTIDILMAPVYNHVAIHIRYLGKVILVSVMPLVQTDTLIP